VFYRGSLFIQMNGTLSTHQNTITNAPCGALRTGGVMNYAADGPLEPPWVNMEDCLCDDDCDTCSDESCECTYHERWAPSMDEDYDRER
jgi:hypothetical protein